MLRRLFILATLCVALSGCYMVPLALIGPTTSGFSTASIAQSLPTASAGLVVKKATGKTITEHALDAIGDEIFQQAYFPVKKTESIKSPK